jgi:hypothetical protein
MGIFCLSRDCLRLHALCISCTSRTGSSLLSSRIDHPFGLVCSTVISFFLCMLFLLLLFYFAPLVFSCIILDARMKKRFLSFWNFSYTVCCSEYTHENFILRESVSAASPYRVGGLHVITGLFAEISLL